MKEEGGIEKSGSPERPASPEPMSEEEKQALMVGIIRFSCGGISVQDEN